MNTPWNIRFRESVRTMVRYARDQNRIIGGKDLTDLENAIFGSVELAPSTDNFRLYPFEKLDEERFIAYQYAIEADMNFVTSSLDMMEKKLKNLLLSSEVEQLATTTTERTANLFLNLLRAATFIEGITREILIPEELDVLGTNLQPVGSSLTLKTERALLINRTGYSIDDIEILVTKEQTMINNEVGGDRLSLLNEGFGTGIWLSVYTQRIDTVEATLRIKTRWPETNRITFDLTPVIVGTLFTVEILPTLGEQPVQLFSDIVNRETIVIEMAPTKVEQLIVKMEKDFPDIKNENNIIYQFRIEKIRAENTTTARTGIAISKAIELAEGTEHIALVVEDFIPEGSTITYEVAPVADEIEVPSAYYSIIPNNQDPATDLIANELPPERFISLAGGRAETSITTPTRWNLPLVEEFDTRIFNLLSGMQREISADLEIRLDNGMERILPLGEGTEILPDTLELYNGIEDWEKVEEELIEEDAVSGIVLESVYDDEYPSWFNEVDMVEPITENISKKVGDTNTLTVTYPIYGRDGFRLADEEGRSIATIINSGIGTDTITINYVLNTDSIYTVSYYTAQRETTEIVESSLVIRTEETELESGIDYIYSPVNRKLILLRGSTNLSSSSVLSASYTRKTTSESGIGTYFRTWVELDRTTTLEIQPFNPYEVSSGNFHRIDGVDTSLDNSVELAPGMHEIVSSQPEPSATGLPDGNDVNIATNIKSKAGIFLEGYSYRAFRYPMRRISVSDLEYNTAPGERKVFAYDNGAILIPRQPSFIEQAVLDIPTTENTIGDFLRNKKLSTQSSKFLTHPERFSLKVAYRLAEHKRYVRIRITMNRGGTVSPRVERLGIVPVREKII